MHNSEPPDSSLQAILYVDVTAAAKVKQHRPNRLPNIIAMGICILTAACAVIAVTYKVKQAPALAFSQNASLHVTHAAAALLHPAAAVATPAVPAVLVGKPVLVAKPTVTAQPVVMTKPAMIAKPVAVVVKPVVIANVVKPLTVVKPAVRKHVPTTHAQRLALKHRIIAHHRHLHRRLAALMVAPPATAKFAIVAKTSGAPVADPVIMTFEASPVTIPQGSGATLCVSAHHATQLSISEVGELNPLLLDCRHVSPAVTTTYTAWAVNNLGVTVSQNVTVTVTH